MTNDEASRIAEQLASSFKRLSQLPVESIRELSAAAALLGSLADEELVRRER